MLKKDKLTKMEAGRHVKNRKKVIFTVAMLTFLSWQASAQNSFPTSDAVWNVYYRPPASYCPENRAYFISGDTLINGEIWTKIVLTNSTNEDIYQGAYLETNKIVRFHSPNGKTDTIYDFNIDIGDTVSFVSFRKQYPEHFDYMGWSDTSLIVHKVDSILIENNFRKRIEFKPIMNSIEVLFEIWIEGIGSVHGILFPLAYRALSDELQEKEDLTCFSENSNLLWQHPYYLTCEELKVNQHAINNSIEIFPNPVYRFLTITIGEEQDVRNASIEIFDICGKKMFVSDLQSGTNTVNLSDCTSGVYFLKLQINNAVSFFVRTVQKL